LNFNVFLLRTRMNKTHGTTRSFVDRLPDPLRILLIIKEIAEIGKYWQRSGTMTR